jgi:two-component system sensor histidine kinase UhpB
MTETCKSDSCKLFVMQASPWLRQQMATLIAELPSLVLAGDADDAWSAIAAIAALNPHIVLIELGEETHRAAADLLTYLESHRPECRIIVLSRSRENLARRNALDKLRKVLEETDGTRSSESLVLPDGIRYRVDAHLAYAPVPKELPIEQGAMPERRRQEAERLKAAARLQTFIEHLPGIPYIAACDPGHGLLFIGHKIEALLGFSAQALCSNPRLREMRWHPDDREMIHAAISNAVASRSSFNMEYRMLGRNGEICWLHDEARVILNDSGRPLFLQGGMQDITERKQAQAELERSHGELLRMIGALDRLRHEEHQRLAREIHDDFAQILAAMRMDLITLQARLPKRDIRLQRHVSGLAELVDAMATSVRRIIADMPPKMLDELGLYKAIDHLLKGIRRRYGISCSLQRDFPEQDLSPQMNAMLYRIVQEALNNVVKHAGATRVAVEFSRQDSALLLTVSDNGCGIAPGTIRPGISFGLAGMRERCHTIGGEMRVSCNADGGTTISILVPPRKENEIGEIGYQEKLQDQEPPFAAHRQ